MIRRTFLDKSTTIVNNSKNNFGLHPIVNLTYGAEVSRILVHFPISEDMDDNAKHVLKMTNCASLYRDFVKETDVDFNVKRATSFDVIAFAIPQEWDEGIGFDDTKDVWLIGDKSESQEGSNWFNAMTGLEWRYDETKKCGTPGIYTTNELGVFVNEYNNRESGQTTTIISRQHFDHGNENLEIDLTSYVNDCINGKRENYGICLAFSPYLEGMDREESWYVGFFGRHTRTFFEPILESRSAVGIKDDRNRFYAGRLNRLYHNLFINGKPTDYDKVPTCTIDGEEYTVNHDSTGVYYIEVDGKKYAPKTIIYDTWSNLKYNGFDIEDVEMSAIVQEPSYIKNSINTTSKLSVSLSGINDYEKLTQDDVRLVNVTYRIPYEGKQGAFHMADDAKYRLYVKDGNREYDVIKDDICTQSLDNYIIVDCTQLVPNEYHIDVIARTGMETKVFKNLLTFTIVDNITDRKL